MLEGSRMRLGEFELTTVSGGRFRIDGGTMFGVVPKPLWERSFPPDEWNTIPQATNCLLVRVPGRTALIDTGYGGKLAEKQRRQIEAEAGDPLAASLAAAGVTAEQIGLVLLTHLHFDHAGGATRRDEASRLVPTFPNAEYVVQRREWELATAGLPELRGSYPTENFVSLADGGRLRLIDGDAEVTPGIHALVTGGHTPGHQAFLIESGGETAAYLADICPTTRHLKTLWCMGYDLDLLATRRAKRTLLGRATDEGWLVLFDHDPDVAAARIGRDDVREFVVKEAISVI
jgi:glyoxylase-like metal-dependent hydrolase (beta-lactamase superfamily II)